MGASPYASLPFAMGSRSCIGRKIAETQMHVALTKVWLHWLYDDAMVLIWDFFVSDYKEFQYDSGEW